MIALVNCTLLYSPPEQVTTSDTEIAYSTYEDNKMETVFEFITEEWMDIENCVPDQDNGQDVDGQWKVKTFDYCSGIIYISATPPALPGTPIYTGYIQPTLYSFDKSPATPPPDVA